MIRFMLRPDVAVRVPACFPGCRFAAGAYGGQQKRAWQQFSQWRNCRMFFRICLFFRFIQYLLVFSRRLIRMLSFTQPDD